MLETTTTGCVTDEISFEHFLHLSRSFTKKLSSQNHTSTRQAMSVIDNKIYNVIKWNLNKFKLQESVLDKH